MRKRINLLKAQKRFIFGEQVFSKLKTAIMLIFVFFLFIYAAFYYLLSQQKREIDELATQKKELIEFFIQNKEKEAKFVYFRNKQKQLSDILKEDVNFFPYYNLLKESLNAVNANVRLDSVLIDKSKSVKFSLGFEDYSSLLNFLSFAESDDFLKNFNQLALVNFSKNEIQVANNDYKLNFSGKFSNLNEN